MHDVLNRKQTTTQLQSFVRCFGTIGIHYSLHSENRVYLRDIPDKSLQSFDFKRRWWFSLIQYFFVQSLKQRYSKSFAICVSSTLHLPTGNNRIWRSSKRLPCVQALFQSTVSFCNLVLIGVPLYWYISFGFHHFSSGSIIVSIDRNNDFWCQCSADF